MQQLNEFPGRFMETPFACYINMAVKFGITQSRVDGNQNIKMWEAASKIWQ